MKLSPDKQSLRVNESLTLAGIPPETFHYRLGSRSALDWILDQYQIKGDSDPNREDDPGYIVRLIGQVVRVSLETRRIVTALPAFRSSSDRPRAEQQKIQASGHRA
jgi:predicted helicase